MARGEIHIQLVVTYSQDPKMRGLIRYGRDARACRDLYVQMICYAKLNLTDGFVPAEEIGVLVYPDTPRAGVRDADRLAEVGLIAKVEGGYLISAYLKRNKSREEVEAETAARVAAGRLGGQRSGVVRRAEAKPKQNRSKTEAKPKQNASPDEAGCFGLLEPIDRDIDKERSETSFPHGAAAPSEINAGTVVSAWVEAFTGSTGRKPSNSMRAQAGREARQLLETSANADLVLAAAKAVGSKGLACVEREFAPLVARNRVRVVPDAELTAERVDQVLGPDRQPYRCPPDIEEGDPAERQRWYADERQRRLTARRVEAAKILERR